MKERPIIFSSEMVRAILEGRKTMTRRPITPPPQPCNSKTGEWNHLNWGTDVDWREKPTEFYCDALNDLSWACSYCGNGVKLFPTKRQSIGIKCPFGKIGDRLWVRETWGRATVGPILYKATDKGFCIKWRASIHMPKNISRIKLEITNIRVERMQEINIADVRNEGLVFSRNHPAITQELARSVFQELWNSIYPGSWERNDWVWVIEFRRV